jgi:hypothetical protein
MFINHKYVCWLLGVVGADLRPDSFSSSKRTLPRRHVYLRCTCRATLHHTIYPVSDASQFRKYHPLDSFFIISR